MRREPIVAWRSWTVGVVGDEVRLCSLTYRNVEWPPRNALVAACMSFAKYGEDHRDCPVKWHTCGIYAVKSREQASWWADAARGQFVTGRVSLWGRVIPHEHGWRAQKAYPLALEVPAELRSDVDIDPRELVNLLRKVYIVDVDLVSM